MLFPLLLIFPLASLGVATSSAPPAWNGQCVVDSPSRVLPYNGGRANDRTPANCIALCREKNYKLAGVQDGSECYCGNTGPASTTSGAECNRLCPGDSSKICGGNWRMNVYSTTGWTPLSTGDYLFSTAAGSWEEGRALCAREGGTLVEIRSKDESNAIGEFIDGVTALRNSKHWIGLSDQDQENDWRWQGSNLAATEGFTNWYRGEPNNWGGKEHCAEIYSNGKWIDDDCTQSRPPVCQKGCSNFVSLSGNGLNGMPSGLYKKQAEEHNNKPVYKYNGDVASAGEWCIFQGKLGAHGGHWKVDTCGFLWGPNQGDWSQGYASSKVPANCPEDIGNQWRYYSWEGDSDSGPVDPDLRLTPGDSMSESGFSGGVCDAANTDFDWCPRVKETSLAGIGKRAVSCWTLPCWKLNHCPRYKNAKRPKAVIRAFPCCCAHVIIHGTEQYKAICKLGNV